jgi:hypothetical protein
MHHASPPSSWTTFVARKLTCIHSDAPLSCMGPSKLGWQSQGIRARDVLQSYAYIPAITSERFPEESVLLDAHGWRQPKLAPVVSCAPYVFGLFSSPSHAYDHVLLTLLSAVRKTLHPSEDHTRFSTLRLGIRRPDIRAHTCRRSHKRQMPYSSSPWR